MFSLLRIFVWLCVANMMMFGVLGPSVLTWILWGIADRPANDFSHGWVYLSGFGALTGWLYFACVLSTPIYKVINYNISKIGRPHDEQRTEETD